MYCVPVNDFPSRGLVDVAKSDACLCEPCKDIGIILALMTNFQDKGIFPEFLQ